MSFYEREKKLINIIMQQNTISIDELIKKMYVSKSTLRRDLIMLEKKGIIMRMHGGVMAKGQMADDTLPFVLRENEQNSVKQKIAEHAAKLVSDGCTIMLDATTSVCSLVPYLAAFKDIIVITSGARVSYMLGELGIKNICTGGEMINKSFSYIGCDAVRTISSYNADIAFFSCRGISDDGFLSDNSVKENEVRRAMLGHSKRKVFLCNSDKIGNKYFNNLCHVSEIDDIISDIDVSDRFKKS